jgi:hypothetical protein
MEVEGTRAYQEAHESLNAFLKTPAPIKALVVLSPDIVRPSKLNAKIFTVTSRRKGKKKRKKKRRERKKKMRKMRKMTYALR